MFKFLLQLSCPICLDEYSTDDQAETTDDGDKIKSRVKVGVYVSYCCKICVSKYPIKTYILHRN